MAFTEFAITLSSVIVAVILAQIIKVLLHWKQTSKLDLRVSFADGSFPSNHTAMVAALCVAILLVEGLSTLFVAVLVLLLIVARDAVGVRQQVGSLTRFLTPTYSELKHYSGHTVLEMIGGLCVGAVSSCVVYLLFIL